jgi:hypothetical protein
MVELRRPQRGLWRSKQQRRRGRLPGLSGLMGVNATLLQCQGVGADLTCFPTDISTNREIIIVGG